jgi:MerR family redox-sensitive transcriptional activator SoxR
MTAPSSRDRLSIGELAARSGIAHSALRYYEELGLIHAERTAGGRRHYARQTLRRLAFVKAAQTVGLSLEEARDAMAGLPIERSPTLADWRPVATAWQARIDEQIADLQQLRARLTGCVGCGCLSVTKCALYNPDDVRGQEGPGPRHILPRRG